jgi:hypothetical protein
MRDGGSLSRTRKNIHMHKNSSRIGMTFAQGRYPSLQRDCVEGANGRWRRGLHATKRLQFGDGLTNGDQTPSTASSAFDDREYTQEEKEKILHHRRATFLGSLTMGVGKALDESEELPFQSKSLEQQHWYVPVTRGVLIDRLEMIDWKHRYGMPPFIC